MSIGAAASRESRESEVIGELFGVVMGAVDEVQLRLRRSLLVGKRDRLEFVGETTVAIGPCRELPRG